MASATPGDLGKRLPFRLGPCQLERELGSGSMGAVFLGRMAEDFRELSAGAAVAVKVLHPALLAAAGDFRERFRREAVIGASVVHPAVVRTYAAEEAELGGVLYSFLVLEYASGQTLRALMDQLRILPEPLARDMGAQIARGLEAIHSAGALHRDLKPQNVLITPDHQVKLMDLGVARLLDESQPLTRFGEFVGSPAYAAPEQFGEDKLGPPADLYALGALLYEAVTAVQPFVARGFHAIMRRHFEYVPERASERNPQVSRFLEEVLLRLLEKRPDRRFQSAAELAEILERGEASAWWRERERTLEKRGPGPSPRLIRVARDTAILGRERELETLREHFLHAREGEGGVLLVEGEAGVGKTRLIDEFVRSLGSEPEAVQVLYGSSAPGGVFGGRGALAEAVVEEFGAADLESRLRPHLSDTRLLAPAFSAYLTGAPPPRGSEPLVADALHAVFCDLARGLSAERPVVWIVEDLHYATADGRALLLSLARIAHDRRLCLIASSRGPLASEEGLQFERTGHFRRISLPRLSARDVVRLLSHALSSEPLAERLGGIVALKSDGNPFFVLEMLRELKERQVLEQRPDGWYANLDKIDAFEVPSSIQEMFRARLKDLDDRDRELLDVGAVQGFSFDPDLVARVLGRKRLEALQALARIERRSGVVRATGAGFEFDHHQLQETLYAALPPVLRAEYHGLTAQVYEEREGLAGRPPGSLGGSDVIFLAEHLLRGARREAGLALVLRAVEELASRYRNESLLGLCDLALGAVGDDDPTLRADLRLAEAACLDRLGRREAQRRAVSDALEAAARSGDPIRLARAQLADGQLAFGKGDYETARRTLSGVAAEVRAAGETRLEGQVLVTLSNVLTGLGRYEESRSGLERAVDLARAAADRYAESRALGNLGNVFWVGGEYHRARASYEQQLALAREIGDRMGETVATGNLGAVLEALGQLDHSRQQRQRYLDLSREIGNREGESIALLSLGEIALLEGDRSEAEERIRAGLASSREHGQVRVESFGIVLEAQLIAERGEHEKARELLLGLIGAPLSRMPRAVEALVVFHLGRLLLQCGDRAAGEARLEQAAELCARLGLGAPGPLPAAYLAWIGARPAAQVEISTRHSAAVRAEAHLILHRAGAGGNHLEAARELLQRLSSHLSAAARDMFWRNNPVAHMHRELSLP